MSVCVPSPPCIGPLQCSSHRLRAHVELSRKGPPAHDLSCALCGLGPRPYGVPSSLIDWVHDQPPSFHAFLRPPGYALWRSHQVRCLPESWILHPGARQIAPMISWVTCTSHPDSASSSRRRCGSCPPTRVPTTSFDGVVPSLSASARMDRIVVALSPNSLSRAGIILAEGFGLKLHVHRGTLVIEDGEGACGRRAQFVRSSARGMRVVPSAVRDTSQWRRCGGWPRRASASR